MHCEIPIELAKSISGEGERITVNPVNGLWRQRKSKG